MKTKRLWMIAIAALFMAAFVGGCKNENVGIVGKCPLVLSTDPINGATNVPRNKIITVTFNVDMNPLTINNTSFTVAGSVVQGNVTYANKVASFTPTSDLISNHTYTGTISKRIKDNLGQTLQDDYVWSFTTGTAIAPTVILTDPVNLAIDVAVNKVVTATFSDPMNQSTLIGANFSLKRGATTIFGTVTKTATTVSFDPSSNLLPGTTYTATLTTGIKKLDEGTPLANDYVWTFTTVPVPRVKSTVPVNLATGVALINTVVTATFSVPMDTLTLIGANFSLKHGATTVFGTVTHTDTTVSFTPTNPLLSGVMYTATITTGAKSTAGIALANNYVWTFTTLSIPTVIATDPLNGATGILLKKVITATFSEPMNQTTLISSHFSLKHGVTTAAGTVSQTDSTISFTPSGTFLPGTLYIATITTGVKSAAGIAMAIDYVWTFTTIAAIAPTVISTDPLDLATGVALNKVVKATFSVFMDQSTLVSANYTLKQGVIPVAGLVTKTDTTISFTPTVNLLSSTTYTATVTTGAQNVAGTAMASDYVWSFTTGAALAPTVISTDPLDLATGVALNKVVLGTFSEPMNQTTLVGANFTLKLGATTVGGLVTNTATTISFTPTINLLSDATYTATITTGVENLAGTALVTDYVWTFNTGAHLGPAFVDLLSAARFGIFAFSTVTNNAGPSVINDLDVGIYGTRSSITGFPPGTIVNGNFYAFDDPVPTPAMLTQAQADLVAAYLFAEAAVSPAPASAPADLGGQTLAPGIWKSATTMLLQNGDLTLDAQGDANATWIFQIGSAFTSIGGAGGNVILAGGAQAKNVFWQVGSSATIGDNTIFYGNILALTSITMGVNTVATGRMLVQTGAVVLTSTDIINKP